MGKRSRDQQTPRLADIAEATGFSIATASRALDDHPGLSPETKQIVIATAKAQGYPLRDPATKNSRQRKPRRSGAICVVMPVALPNGSRLATVQDRSDVTRKTGSNPVG
ncbi:LacI family DNA-binding transcriptional regulator [Novosphingobium sp.]|uniref:LacI family DNA-binding transcriptional regulator n=1 Tax=Novosphingobium sp. TaxID=1874826 RepID=UPI0038B6D60C